MSDQRSRFALGMGMGGGTLGGESDTPAIYCKQKKCI